MTNTKPDTLGCMVKQRNASQIFMLRVHRTIEDFKPEISSNERMRAISGFLVGIAFSLWRAVFLALDPKREAPEAVVFAGSTMLLQLVRENSLTFGQENNLKQWTVGYYLNNANYRIRDSISRFLAVRTESDIKLGVTWRKKATHPVSLDASELLDSYPRAVRGTAAWFLKGYGEFPNLDPKKFALEKSPASSDARALLDFLANIESGITQKDAGGTVIQTQWGLALSAAEVLLRLFESWCKECRATTAEAQQSVPGDAPVTRERT